MSICNLFRPIVNKTGTFFMFSEVSKQLTKVLSNPQISIMPSKFVCLNLPDFKINTSLTSVKTGNEYLPELLQNYFENKIAFLPQANKNNDYKYNYSERDIERSFWAMINKIYPNDFKINFENKTTTAGVEYLEEISNFITYIGDINIVNYQEYDNVGYSEIFMHIPSEGVPIKNVLFNTNWTDENNTSTSNKNITFDLTYNNGQKYTPDNPKLTETILGYPKALPYPNSNNMSLTNIGIFDKESSISSDNNKDTYVRPDYYIGFNQENTDYHYTGLRLVMDSNYLSQNVETTNFKVDSSKNAIEFNAILVYFRIVDNTSSNNLSTTNGIDIPYGIYITSDIETTTSTSNEINCHFVNNIKKYINKESTNDSIYTQQTGSGYVLKLIARYLSIPNGTVYPVIEFSKDITQDITIYSELLAYIQKSQELMNSSTAEIYNIKNTINKIYTGVQENQFNVPQIFKKSNNYWWYINYKNTGHRANGLSAYEVFIDSLPEDEQKNPPTIQEWLDSLVLKSLYKQVLYSSTNILKDTGVEGKTWGEIYPNLLQKNENGIATNIYNLGLVELIQNNSLIPGMYYEIVDYKTTQNISTTNTKIIPYEPIVVQAATVNSITEDGYYANYSDWKVKYSISNSVNKFNWALGDSTTIGRGCIYKLYNNKYNISFPYDIFNIYYINPEDENLFVQTFNYRNKNNTIISYSELNNELNKISWNSDLNNINILPFYDNTIQLLNNYIFVYNQGTLSDGNIFNNIYFNGLSTNTLSNIIEYCGLKNIKFEYIKNVNINMIVNDGNIIYNLDIKPLDEELDAESINKIKNIILSNNMFDPHFPFDDNVIKFNPLVKKNIYKEMLQGYYYSKSGDEILSRILIKYISGDGTTQILTPTIS